MKDSETAYYHGMAMERGEYEAIKRGEQLFEPLFGPMNEETETRHLQLRDGTAREIQIIWSSTSVPQDVHLRAEHSGRRIGTMTGEVDTENQLYRVTEAMKTALVQHDCGDKQIAGSGCWDEKLLEGQHMHLWDVVVAEQWRRKGLGTLMFSALLEKVRSNLGCVPDYVFVIPADLEGDERHTEGKSKEEQVEIKEGLRKGRLRFYRSLGFRRIGPTHCFARATDPDHPSRQIAEDADYDPAEEPVIEWEAVRWRVGRLGENGAESL